MKAPYMPHTKDPSIIAVLRGVTPTEVVDIGAALVRAGIKVIEVPLNSPEPLLSIESLASRFGDVALCGAGTVLTPNAVDEVCAVGGRLIVTPNTNTAVIRRAIQLRLDILPGFFTPSEAFEAIEAGATQLKLFPAASLGTEHLKAIRAVTPKDVDFYAVGGINFHHIKNWVQAGVRGVGVGGELYRPGDKPSDVERRAEVLVAASAASRLLP